MLFRIFSTPNYRAQKLEFVGVERFFFLFSHSTDSLAISFDMVEIAKAFFCSKSDIFCLTYGATVDKFMADRSCFNNFLAVLAIKF